MTLHRKKEQMMQNPLISIIIPAYNVEKYLQRCLDSILNQTYQNLEIIVIDDGSTDSTAAILDQYAEKDKRIIAIHKQNGGVSSARMAGLDRAAGEYIGFIDSDDYVDADMFEHLINNALEYNADISHCGYVMEFPDGHTNSFYATGRFEIQNNEEGVYDLLCGDYVEPCLCNKIYRCTIAKQYKNEKIWKSEIRYNEDLLMNYVFFKHAEKSVYEDIAYYHYILRKESATKSNNTSKQLKDAYRVLSVIKNDTSEPKLHKVAYERYLRVLINLATKSEYQNDRAMAKRILKKELLSAEDYKECGSAKLKAMVFGVVFMFPVYKCIRLVYDKVTRIDKRYNVD